MSNYFTGTVNPNIKGGSSSIDSRSGLGIGELDPKKNPASGLGSNWNMGDIYSPKGEWDYIDEEEIDDEDSSNSEDEIDTVALKVNRKASKTYNVTPTDSLAVKGRSIGYLGGIGAISLRAGKEIKGISLVENYIKEVLKEYSSSSGNIAIQSKGDVSKNLGSKNRSSYIISKSTSHTNKIGNSISQKSKGIDQGGIGQRARTPDNLEPYVVPGLPVDSDGALYIYTDKHDLENKSDEIDFNNGMSSFEVILDDLDKESKDIANFLNKNKL